MEGGSIGINQRTTQLHFIMEARVGTSGAVPTAEFRSLQTVTECSDGDWCHIVPATKQTFPQERRFASTSPLSSQFQDRSEQ